MVRRKRKKNKQKATNTQGIALTSLLPHIGEFQVVGNEDARITGVTCHSDQVTAGNLFIAIRGQATDGNSYIGKANEKGAAVILAERTITPPPGGAAVQVPSARIALANLASAYFGHPSQNLHMVGITGTNGKTTTAWLLEGILMANHHKTAMIGTLGRRLLGADLPQAGASNLTTPDPIELQKTLAELYVSGATHVVVEVSSHALDQHRVVSCNFDVGVFTNLSQDHLDYHGDFHGYFAAKRRLFDVLLHESTKENSTAVINLDDMRGKELANDVRKPVQLLSFSRDPHSDTDVKPLDIIQDASGTRGRISTPLGIITIESKLVGAYNLSNILAAIATASALGVSKEAICEGLETTPGAPGRMESIENSLGLAVLVDYAHTPDALGNALAAIKEMASSAHGKTICVFGCGGDRDVSKRPRMGEIASKISDQLIITNDNPRSENPQSIIHDIIAGIPKESNYKVEPDRSKAIDLALELATPGDTILIAGKGHETKQLIGQDILHFDDRKVAASLLKRRGNREGLA